MGCKMHSDKWGLREMTDDEVVEWTAGWKTTRAEHIAGMQELKRRHELPNSRRSWIAIGISLFSVSVALTSLLVSLT